MKYAVSLFLVFITSCGGNISHKEQPSNASIKTPSLNQYLDSFCREENSDPQKGNYCQYFGMVNYEICFMPGANSAKTIESIDGETFRHELLRQILGRQTSECIMTLKDNLKKSAVSHDLGDNINIKKYAKHTINILKNSEASKDLLISLSNSRHSVFNTVMRSRCTYYSKPVGLAKACNEPSFETRIKCFKGKLSDSKSWPTPSSLNEELVFRFKLASQMNQCVENYQK